MAKLGCCKRWEEKLGRRERQKKNMGGINRMLTRENTTTTTTQEDTWEIEEKEVERSNKSRVDVWMWVEKISMACLFIVSETIAFLLRPALLVGHASVQTLWLGFLHFSISCCWSHFMSPNSMQPNLYSKILILALWKLLSGYILKSNGWKFKHPSVILFCF